MPRRLRRPRSLALAALVLALGACSGGASGTDPSLSDADRQRAQTLFTDSCAGCHTLSAADASGTTGPELDGAGLSADTVTERVREGARGMPAFAGQLSAERIDLLARYVAESSR